MREPTRKLQLRKWACAGSNRRPLPCQSGSIRFSNDLTDRGHCQNTRKSYKIHQAVGWVVGWKTPVRYGPHPPTLLAANPLTESPRANDETVAWMKGTAKYSCAYCSERALGDLQRVNRSY